MIQLTAKEWLQRARNIDNEIKTLREQKEILFTELTKCTVPTDGERVGGSRLNTREQKQIKYADLCEILERKEIGLLVLKAEIIKAIENIPDSVSRTILYERYINFKKWHQIARTVHYSDKHIIQKLHPKALRYIEKIINL